MSRLCCFIVEFVRQAWFIDFNESFGRKEKMAKKERNQYLRGLQVPSFGAALYTAWDAYRTAFIEYKTLFGVSLRLFGLPNNNYVNHLIG